MKLSLRSMVYVSSGALVLLLSLLLIVWMWEPAKELRTPRPKPIQVADIAEPPAPRAKKELVIVPPMLEARKEGDVLERLKIDPKITPHCALINQWHDRNVPMWVILDNLDAQAMRFDLVEMECLTASPIPPGILTFAENHEEAMPKKKR